MPDNTQQTEDYAPTNWPHRAVGGLEHDGSVSAFHGCCRICAVPWPCPSQRALDEAVLRAVGADMETWERTMADNGWAAHTKQATP